MTFRKALAAACSTLVFVATAGAEPPATVARGKSTATAAPVYFAVHGNPFMAVYTAKGFERKQDASIDELLQPWKTALQGRHTFRGLTADGRRVRVNVLGLNPLQGGMYEVAFKTDSDALFWSAPELEVRSLTKIDVPVRSLDEGLLRREAAARTQAWIENGVIEMMYEPPARILDPRLPGNLRLSASGWREDADHVIVRAEFLVAEGRRPLERRLLLLYSRARRAVLGHVVVGDPRFLAFQVEGDPAVYLVYEVGSGECDGTTLVPLDRIRGPSSPEWDVTVSVWCS